MHVGNTRVWRKAGDYSKSSAFVGKRQMDGGVSSTGVALLLYLDENLNGENYIGYLNQYIIPMILDVLDEMNNATEEEFDSLGYVIYADDNAQPHSSHAVCEAIGQNGITSINWPPYSPDINIIENVWAELKYRVFENGMKVFNNRVDIEASIYQHFWTIVKERGYIKNLYSSLPRRVTKIIAAQGGNIKI